MKTHFLFPSRCRSLGFVLFTSAILLSIALRISGVDLSSHLETTVPAIANAGILSRPEYFTLIRNPVLDELVLLAIIAGGILAGFSKLKYEDEFTGQIRYESLVWATYANFAVIFLATLFVYGGFYFEVMVANIFTLLVFFLIRFELKLRKLKNDGDDQ